MAVSQSVSLTQTSQSVAENYSLVTFKWTSTQTGESHNDLTKTAYYYVSINGGSEKKYSVTYTLPRGSTKTIVEKSIKVAHKADGTGSIKVRTYMSTGISAGVIEKSVSKTLTTIPRTSTFSASASSVYISANSSDTTDNKVTFTITRASSSFTHKLTYKFGSTSGTIGTDIGTSKAWTVPTSLADQIPNATSGTCTVTCTTYSGSTAIGSKTLNLTLKVKSTVVPTVTFTVAEAVSNIATTFGVYVKTLSKLKITATGTGVNKSTIKSYKISANGATYNSASATTGLLKTSGSMKITVTVTDSRGRTGSAEKTITVYNYSTPTINRFNIARCNSDGTPNEEGTSVLVDISASVANVNSKNAGTYTLQYKKSTDSSYTQTVLESEVLSYTNNAYKIDNIDTESTYEFRLVVSDKVKTFIGVLPLSTAFVLVDYFEDGTGIAFGKVATEPGKADFNLQIIARAGFKNILLPPETDLNTVLTPNSYYGENVANYNYVNSPLTSGTFDLEVVSPGDKGQVKQRVTSCSKTDARTFERFYYSGAWGEWVCVSDYKGTLLWEGNYYMSDTQTANLSEAVSKQPSGIVLVFARYIEGNDPYSWNSFFVPKRMVPAPNGTGHNFIMATGEFTAIATKYLYIRDTQIAGNATNKDAGTVNGITYDNSAFTLRYVIGV